MSLKEILQRNLKAQLNYLSDIRLYKLLVFYKTIVE